MVTNSQLLKRLATHASTVPKQQDYLKVFIRRLVENPAYLTVLDTGIVASLTQNSPAELLNPNLCWSEMDMQLKIVALLKSKE